MKGQIVLCGPVKTSLYYFRQNASKCGSYQVFHGAVKTRHARLLGLKNGRLAVLLILIQWLFLSHMCSKCLYGTNYSSEA